MPPVAATPAVPSDRDHDDIPGEIKRDRWKRPLILQIGPDGVFNGESVGYTRASTLGKALEDETGITRWKLRTAVWGLARSRPQIVAAASIQTVSEKPDKEALDKIVERAHGIAGNDDKSTLGTALHALGERVDRGEPVPDIGEDRWALQAYGAAMTTWFEVVRSETFVVNDELRAAGTFDRLVKLRHDMQPVDRKGNPVGPVLPAGTLVILDVKTSATSDYFGIAFCVQCAVYQGGKLYDPVTGARTEHGAHPRWAIILHVPSGGNIAEMHWVDLDRGRELAQLAVTVREWRKVHDLIVPAVLPAIPPAVVKDPPQSGEVCPVHGVHRGTVDCVECGPPDFVPPVPGDVGYGPPDMGPVDPPVPARLELADVPVDVPHVEARGCAECTTEDPSPWCGCRAGESCPAGHVCRQRAHHPDGCPELSGPASPPVADVLTELAPVVHAAAISGGLMQAHARRVLLDLIGRAGSEDECMRLWQANGRVWVDEHNGAVRARLAVLAAHAAAQVPA